MVVFPTISEGQPIGTPVYSLFPSRLVVSRGRFSLEATTVPEGSGGRFRSEFRPEGVENHSRFSGTFGCRWKAFRTVVSSTPSSLVSSSETHQQTLRTKPGIFTLTVEPHLRCSERCDRRDVYRRVRERFVSTSRGVYPMSRYHHGYYGETETNCSEVGGEPVPRVVAIILAGTRFRPSPL